MYDPSKKEAYKKIWGGRKCTTPNGAILLLDRSRIESVNGCLTVVRMTEG